MASDRGRPLPKFGEWDVNNPASAEGFTVIFNKARDDKKTNNTNTNTNNNNNNNNNNTPRNNNNPQNKVDTSNSNSKRRWFCCG